MSRFGLGFIAGQPVSLIITHTSATSASGTADASTTNGTRFAWQAFDGSTATVASDAWQASTSTGWLRYHFAIARTVTSYHIRPISDDDPSNTNRAPKTWTFEGSDDGSSWTTLDTQTNVASWGATESREYYVDSPKSFAWYRINITADQGGANLTIAEMRLMGF